VIEESFLSAPALLVLPTARPRFTTRPTTGAAAAHKYCSRNVLALGTEIDAVIARGLDLAVLDHHPTPDVHQMERV
jgi:hypothetical protein